jgi:hypothetical protein
MFSMETQMSAPAQLIGQRFGRLTVLARAGSDRNQHTLWRCCCDCGTFSTTRANALRMGKATSCGCYNREVSRNQQPRLTHGHTVGPKPSRIFRIWCGMKARCTYPSSNSWKYYGGRGIKVCPEWQQFDGFRRWVESRLDYAPDRSIDRIDNDGDYTPSNCQWSTPRKQVANRRKRGT